jgi:hypothetical protein
MLRALKRFGMVLAAWTPFFVIWVLLVMSYAHVSVREAFTSSLISMGSAMVLGTPVWYLCARFPWPFRPSLRFYLFHVACGLAYSICWAITTYALESLRRGINLFHQFWLSPSLGWQLMMGAWIYGLVAGVSYATQIRNRLHEKELLASKAEALANAARLDAIRARLNPHFLFNALHTLSALVKFRPAMAEEAIERLGDMLRYALKEDGRELVEFSEELDFTKQYLAFEQLRYEDRLRVDVKIEDDCTNFDIPPFSIQTLAENAVRHAISIRPEGGSIWIQGSCHDGKMRISIKDDGSGETKESIKSHQIGLRSLKERLAAAFGVEAKLETRLGEHGFEACFEVPAPMDVSSKVTREVNG